MNEYVCIKEDDIAKLEAEVKFKEKRIDEMNKKIDKMDDKIDTINENVNKIVQNSIQSDNNLEIRLTKIETDMANQKDENKRRITMIGIALTIVTILINIYFNMMH